MDQNAILSFLQYLGLHPQGAQVPNPQPGDTGGYWNAQRPQTPGPTGGPFGTPTGTPSGGVNYQMTIPSISAGKSSPMSMMGGGGGGGGGGGMGGIMGGMTGGQGGGSMMDLAKLAMMFL